MEKTLNWIIIWAGTSELL